MHVTELQPGQDVLPHQFRFHCLHCHHPLVVLRQAIGSRAQCPSCRTQLTVPESDAEFEESVSSWIEEDLEDLWNDEDEQMKVEAPRKAQVAAPTRPLPDYANMTRKPREQKPAAPAAPQAAPPPAAVATRPVAVGPSLKVCHHRLPPIFN